MIQESMNCELCKTQEATAVCTRCRIPVCSKKCMEKNWKSHKSECGYRMWKRKYENLTKEKETTCPICMDNMDGNVTLKCGHQMCPCCFAQHARLNNTCPICRDKFAPPVKAPRDNTIPPEIVEDLIVAEIELCLRDDILEHVWREIDIAAKILTKCEESMRCITQSMIEWYE